VSWDGVEPDGSATDRVAKDLQSASIRANEAYGQLCMAFNKVSDGGWAPIPSVAVARLTETLAATSRHESTSSSSTFSGVLTDATGRARHLENLLTPTGERGTRHAAQLNLLRAAHIAQELAIQLDRAARRAETFGYSGRRPAASHVIEPRQFVLSAGDLRPPPGALQPIEVTMPGVLIGLAVLILPASHRSRYSEEFRGELQDLPAREQVGYAVRQCLVALSLRRGLMGQLWRIRKERGSGAEHAQTRQRP
jgi:hypothetical protein